VCNTSACCPGCRTFPHSSQRRHCRCQSNPIDWRLSAANNYMSCWYLTKLWSRILLLRLNLIDLAHWFKISST
jgi:hypothetical protein